MSFFFLGDGLALRMRRAEGAPPTPALLDKPCFYALAEKWITIEELHRRLSYALGHGSNRLPPGIVDGVTPVMVIQKEMDTMPSEEYAKRIIDLLVNRFAHPPVVCLVGESTLNDTFRSVASKVYPGRVRFKKIVCESGDIGEAGEHTDEFVPKLLLLALGIAPRPPELGAEPGVAMVASLSSLPDEVVLHIASFVRQRHNDVALNCYLDDKRHFLNAFYRIDHAGVCGRVEEAVHASILEQSPHADLVGTYQALDPVSHKRRCKYTSSFPIPIPDVVLPSCMSVCNRFYTSNRRLLVFGVEVKPVWMAMTCKAWHALILG